MLMIQKTHKYIMTYVVGIYTVTVDVGISMAKIQSSDFNFIDELHNSHLLSGLSVLFYIKIKLDSYSHQ